MATTLLILLIGYPTVIATYYHLHSTLEDALRWKMFRLLMTIPLTAAAITSTPNVAGHIIDRLTAGPSG